MIARQSTAVAIGNRAVLIEGAPGTGKSSLALALIDRGAVLIGDDSLMLEAAQHRLLAHPHPRTRGLLEVRNLGLLQFAVCERVPVALVLTLAADAPRHVEEAGRMAIAGVDIPHLVIWPNGLTLVLKAELALSRFGLED
jgi:serine kinase of HPr protein (carbohydrate metabolism regulator)